MSRNIQSRVEKLETKAGLNRHRTDYHNMTDVELHTQLFEHSRAAIAEAGSAQALRAEYVALGVDQDLIEIFDEVAECETLQEYLEEQRRQAAH